MPFIPSSSICFFFSSGLDVIGGKYRKRNDDDCRCQCFPHLNTFREDLNICVDDIHGKYLYQGVGSVYSSHKKRSILWSVAVVEIKYR